MKQACMGGWCHLRDHCGHYHAENRANPAERLCLPGQDGVSDVVFMRITKPAGAWESALPTRMVEPPSIFELLGETGS